jgi:hypothetical protein
MIDDLTVGELLQWLRKEQHYVQESSFRTQDGMAKFALRNQDCIR